MDPTFAVEGKKLYLPLNLFDPELLLFLGGMSYSEYPCSKLLRNVMSWYNALV